ncbi:hypothetical protein NS228_05295 [Methylobacterium indicum]|uniref:hypothetical protein n=1 Tax=Methylobacterium indicum TaxID=1775910 RepID=UPI000734CF8C|nr:hypothetical protein [Methylobacterium indicum]KTS41796.1 hypothetical protein NS228_05295 [Methylobacterium indicum]
MDKWTAGLKDLDPVQTRKRLADLIFECNHVADGLERAQGEGLRDHVSTTRLRLEQVAKGEITRLSGMLAEYRSGPPAAEPPKAADPAPAPAKPKVTPPYDAFAAARARADAKAAAEAWSAPTSAPTRPQMPVRGARLPRLTPGRPA